MVANATGIPRNKISLLEKGGRADDKTLFKIADHFNVPELKLVEGLAEVLPEGIEDSSTTCRADDAAAFIEQIRRQSCKISARWLKPEPCSKEDFARHPTEDLLETSDLLKTAAALQHKAGSCTDAYHNYYMAGFMRGIGSRREPDEQIGAINCSIHCLTELRARPVRPWLADTARLVVELWDGKKRPAFLHGRLFSELGGFAVDACAQEKRPDLLLRFSEEAFEKAEREDAPFVTKTELKAMALFTRRTRELYKGLLDRHYNTRQFDEIIKEHDDIGDSDGAGNAAVACACVLAVHDRRSEFLRTLERFRHRIKRANKHTQFLFAAAHGRVLWREGKIDDGESLLLKAFRGMSDLKIRVMNGPDRQPLPFLQFDRMLPGHSDIQDKPLPTLEEFPLVETFDTLYDIAKQY